MAFTYQEFNSTPATLVADLKAKILASSDYTNPTGNVVLATTPLGAKIAVNLNDFGPNAQSVGFSAWRAYSGTTGTDQMQGRYIYYKRNNSGTTANPIHVRVAAGATLLYVDIEGPYASEANADSTTFGSWRQMFAVAQVTPYFTTTPNDTVPAVALLGSTAFNGYTNPNAGVLSTLTHVSRNMADTASWVEAHLEALCFPNFGAASNGSSWNRQAAAADGSTYLSPYVVSEHLAGMRGRLTDVFFAGWRNPTVASNVDPNNGLQEGQVITYGGNTYKVLAPFRTDQSNNANNYGSVGSAQNQGNSIAPLIAVRTA